MFQGCAGLSPNVGSGLDKMSGWVGFRVIFLNVGFRVKKISKKQKIQA
jgi:hypothetical protein